MTDYVQQLSKLAATYRADPVGQVYEKFYGDEQLRTCKKCGTVVPVPPT